MTDYKTYQSIEVCNIKTYSFHGANPIEQKVGQWYIVNITVKGDFSQAIINDDLNETIDYSAINDIVQKEMKIPSKLIEHLAGRIQQKLITTFTKIKGGQVKITKLSPPIIGNQESMIFTLNF